MLPFTLFWAVGGALVAVAFVACVSTASAGIVGIDGARRGDVGVVVELVVLLRIIVSACVCVFSGFCLRFVKQGTAKF